MPEEAKQMKNTFKCDCGNICTLEENEEQTEHRGDASLEETGVVVKCKCCGKILTSGQY